jgi:uncharacterized protein (DUF4213/DUF364 family)
VAILDIIFQALQSRADSRRVTDIRIGLGYTAVLLNDGSAGVAYTLREELSRGCSVFRGERPLAGKPARKMLSYLSSDDPIEAAVGLATANALGNHFRSELIYGDLLENLEIRLDDTVGMVGFFAPLIPELRAKSASLKIFERVKERTGELLPEESAREELPSCQVAIITSTAIINHTIDALLEASRFCREVVLLGASTPLIREIIGETPVTCLSGVVVTRPDRILQIVSEAGGMQFFKDSIQKANLRH